MRCLYVVRLGGAIKIGTAWLLEQRYRVYRREARKLNIVFEPLFALPVHVEADANECAILDRFCPTERRSEYLVGVDPDDVIAFVQTLPCTLSVSTETTATGWMPRMKAAKYLGVRDYTLDMLIKDGQITSWKNETTGRVFVKCSDVEQVKIRRNTWVMS